MSYALTLATGLLAVMQLAKDWKGHQDHWRRGLVLGLIVLLTLGGMANTYSREKSADAEKRRDREQIAGLNSAVEAATTEASKAAAEVQNESARREQAEKDLLKVTHQLQTSAKRSAVQLTGLSDQQAKNGVQTLLLRLSTEITILRKARDEWTAADNEARSKAGPRGRGDPDYIKTKQDLREQYLRQLQPDFAEAKAIQEQLRVMVPEAHLSAVGEDSWLGKAVGEQQLPIEQVNGIIARLSQVQRKVTDLLTPPSQ